MRPPRLHPAVWLALLALILAGSIGIGAEPFRTWKNTKGQSIEARLVERKGDSVILEMRDAKRHEIPVATLSREDIEWLESNEASPSTAGGAAGAVLAVPVIKPLMTEPGKLVFQDDMSEVRKDWSIDYGEWTPDGGALEGVTIPTETNPARYMRRLKFKDAIVQYSFKMEDSRGTAFNVYNGSQHLCRVVIEEDGFVTRLDAQGGGGPAQDIDFYKRKMDVKPGKWHTILIEIKDDTLVAQVDDEFSFGSHPVIEQSEKAAFGLVVYGGSVQFKDFRMWEALPKEGWDATARALGRRMD